MKISSLFKRKSKPQKGGKNSQIEEKISYYLELSGREGSPTYELVSHLTFGQGEADIVIPDAGLSNKHATFILNQDVILLIDHGSEAGTYLNKTKLIPGKSYILGLDESVKLGDLEVKIIKNIEEFEIETEEEEEFVEEESVEEEEIRISSANAFVRVLGFLFDVGLFYSVINLFGSREFFDFLNVAFPIDEIVELVMPFENKLSFVMNAFAVKNSLLFITEGVSLLVGIFVYRLIFALVFKLTPGQILAGMKQSGEPFRERIKSFVREILFFFLSPLVFITHMPTLFSKRSIQEKITNSTIETRSSFKTLLFIILSLPLVTLLVITTPVFKGFDLPEPISYQEDLKINSKIVPIEHSFSKTLKLGSLNSEKIYPSGNIVERVGKKYFYPEAILETQDDYALLSLKKTINFSLLLKNFFSMMIFNEESYSSLRHKVDFHNKKTVMELSQFFNEFLNVDYTLIPEIFFKYGPLFQNIMDFRNSLSLIAEEEISEVKLLYFGKHPVVIFKPRHTISKLYFFPLMDKATPLFEVSFLKANADQKFPVYKKEHFDYFIFEPLSEAEGKLGFSIVEDISRLVSSKDNDFTRLENFYKEGKKESRAYSYSLEKIIKIVDKENKEGRLGELLQTLSGLKSTAQ